jgi:DNA-binding NtrC family response regulator
MTRPARIEETTARGDTPTVPARLIGQVQRSEIVGASAAMERLRSSLEFVARSSAHVLLWGPAGTGKSFVARAIHERSPRRDRQLASVHCAAIPRETIAAELFGASTDKHAPPAGILASGHRSTVHLEEIGDLPRDVQERLADFLIGNSGLEGPTGSPRIDARVIASSRRDLAAAVADGTFDARLHAALSRVVLELPELGKRSGDVRALAEHFFARAAARSPRNVCGFASDALALLEAHAWTDNVRELEDEVERAVLLAPGPWVGPEDIFRRRVPRLCIPVFEEVVWRDDPRREPDDV